MPSNEPAVAPCGPECRFAQMLKGWEGDWVWCARLGQPRAIGGQDCPTYRSRDTAPDPQPSDNPPETNIRSG